MEICQCHLFGIQVENIYRTSEKPLFKVPVNQILRRYVVMPDQIGVISQVLGTRLSA